MSDHEVAKDARRHALGGLRFNFGSVEDLPKVMEVMERSFSKIYGESWNNSQCRSMLSLPGTELFLAWLGHDLSGFAICRTILGEEELLMIAVDPKFQKKGIATTLLQEIESQAVKANADVIFLEVRSNNPAQSLYQRHGFKKIGVRTAYYTGQDKVKYDANTYRKLLKSNK